MYLSLIPALVFHILKVEFVVSLALSLLIYQQLAELLKLSLPPFFFNSLLDC